jgi:peptidoglycan LD-endopeptidase CwlK
LCARISARVSFQRRSLRAASFLRANVRAWYLLLGAMTVPVALALWLAETRNDPTRAQGGGDANASIATILQGEELVAPPPLPPEIFVVPERPQLASANRDWSRLQPEFRVRLLKLLEALEARGYRMALIEGYRSPQRQDHLAGLGPEMANAHAYQSYHQFGLPPMWRRCARASW